MKSLIFIITLIFLIAGIAYAEEVAACKAENA